jgi:large subunit ribosomal protein L29
MKAEEIKGLSIDELKSNIAEQKEQLRKLKFAHAVSEIENPMKIHITKKTIARLNTELTAKLKG